MGLVEDVQTYLGDQGLIDGSTDWPSTRRRLHDESDQLVVLTEDGGPTPEVTAASGMGSAAIRTPGVQVRVRAEQWKADAALSKAQAIYDELHSLTDTQMGTTTYMLVRGRTPEPTFIGYDDQGRPEYTISFLCTASAV